MACWLATHGDRSVDSTSTIARQRYAALEREIVGASCQAAAELDQTCAPIAGKSRGKIAFLFADEPVSFGSSPLTCIADAKRHQIGQVSVYERATNTRLDTYDREA